MDIQADGRILIAGGFDKIDLAPVRYLARMTAGGTLDQTFNIGSGADNPFAAMFGSMNPGDLGAAFQQLGQMLSYEGGPVNWDMAKQIARQTVAQGTAQGSKDASVGPAERRAVEDAVRLADLWLDDATSLPSGANSAWP